MQQSLFVFVFFRDGTKGLIGVVVVVVGGRGGGGVCVQTCFVGADQPAFGCGILVSLVFQNRTANLD